LKINDGVNACKYIEDLINYAKGDTKDGFISTQHAQQEMVEEDFRLDEVLGVIATG
jgi:hypothetical protein